MSKKKIAIIACAVVVALAVIIGVVVAVNGKKEKKAPKKEVATKEVEETRDGQLRSLLTGEWVPEEQAKTRAIAVMIGNTKGALPQYGLNSAGVIYEAPVEGGITRLMAIIEDYKNLTQIGCVRSCRPYYASFAQEFNAVYVHVGQSIHAVEILESGYIDHLSGLDGSVSSTFYRTQEHEAPHNCYVSAKGINEGIQKKGYSTEYAEGYDGHYQFAKDDELNELADGEDCVEIKPYYFINEPSFVYDKDSKKYKRFQYGAEHIDAVDNKQVEVTNIIFQNVDYSIYENTQYLNIDVNSGGAGKFFTNGKMIDVTWKKDEYARTHYYDKNGEEIVLNPGKTWVCIIQNEFADQNEFVAK